MNADFIKTDCWLSAGGWILKDYLKQMAGRIWVVHWMGVSCGCCSSSHLYCREWVTLMREWPKFSSFRWVSCSFCKLVTSQQFFLLSHRHIYSSTCCRVHTATEVRGQHFSPADVTHDVICDVIRIFSFLLCFREDQRFLSSSSSLCPPALHFLRHRSALDLLTSSPVLVSCSGPASPPSCQRSDRDSASGLWGETSPAEAGGELGESSRRPGCLVSVDCDAKNYFII